MQNDEPEKIPSQFQSNAPGYIYTLALACHIPQIHGIELLSFAEPWSMESFNKEFEDGLARYFVALAPQPAGGSLGQAAGYCNGQEQAAGYNSGIGMVAGYCGYWSVAGEAHITNVAVHPSHRRRGVGAGLVACMLGDIDSRGHSAATLEVRVDNHTAIRLYERHGFKPAGVRKKYYDHGKKDALIMWKNRV